MLRSLALVVFLALLRTASVARADIGVRPVTGDFDAEFARAADFLERGDRGQAEAILGEIQRRAPVRARMRLLGTSKTR